MTYQDWQKTVDEFQEWKKTVLLEIKDIDYVIKPTSRNQISNDHSFRIIDIVEKLKANLTISIKYVLHIARCKDDVRQTLSDVLMIIDNWKWFKIKGKANRTKFRNDILHLIHQTNHL